MRNRGDIRFKDLNGDGVINSDDRDFKGNPLPDCSMGLTLGFNYKNFDVSAFFKVYLVMRSII